MQVILTTIRNMIFFFSCLKKSNLFYFMYEFYTRCVKVNKRTLNYYVIIIVIIICNNFYLNLINKH